MRSVGIHANFSASWAGGKSETRISSPVCTESLPYPHPARLCTYRPPAVCISPQLKSALSLPKSSLFGARHQKSGDTFSGIFRSRATANPLSIRVLNHMATPKQGAWGLVPWNEWECGQAFPIGNGLLNWKCKASALHFPLSSLIFPLSIEPDMLHE